MAAGNMQAFCRNSPTLKYFYFLFAIICTTVTCMITEKEPKVFLEKAGHIYYSVRGWKWF